jgi:hypothetical protein
MFTKRQIVVRPGIVCKNCVNYDPLEKCPQQMHEQLCTSFEPVDVGDEEQVGEDVPFTRESLGSADVKQSKRSMEPPKEEVDAEVEEVEEAEVDAGN